MERGDESISSGHESLDESSQLQQDEDSSGWQLFTRRRRRSPIVDRRGVKNYKQQEQCFIGQPSTSRRWNIMLQSIGQESSNQEDSERSESSKNSALLKQEGHSEKQKFPCQQHSEQPESSRNVILFKKESRKQGEPFEEQQFFGQQISEQRESSRYPPLFKLQGIKREESLQNFPCQQDSEPESPKNPPLSTRQDLKQEELFEKQRFPCQQESSRNPPLPEQEGWKQEVLEEQQHPDQQDSELPDSRKLSSPTQQSYKQRGQFQNMPHPTKQSSGEIRSLKTLSLFREQKNKSKYQLRLLLPKSSEYVKQSGEQEFTQTELPEYSSVPNQQIYTQAGPEILESLNQRSLEQPPPQENAVSHTQVYSQPISSVLSSVPHTLLQPIPSEYTASSVQQSFVEPVLSGHIPSSLKQSFVQSVPPVHTASFVQQPFTQSVPPVHTSSVQQLFIQSVPSVHTASSVQQPFTQSVPPVHTSSVQQLFIQSVPSVHTASSVQQPFTQSVPPVHTSSVQQSFIQSVPSGHTASSVQQPFIQPVPPAHTASSMQQSFIQSVPSGHTASSVQRPFIQPVPTTHTASYMQQSFIQSAPSGHIASSVQRPFIQSVPPAYTASSMQQPFKQSVPPAHTESPMQQTFVVPSLAQGHTEPSMQQGYIQPSSSVHTAASYMPQTFVHSGYTASPIQQSLTASYLQQPFTPVPPVHTASYIPQAYMQSSPIGYTASPIQQSFTQSFPTEHVALSVQQGVLLPTILGPIVSSVQQALSPYILPTHTPFSAQPVFLQSVPLQSLVLHNQPQLVQPVPQTITTPYTGQDIVQLETPGNMVINNPLLIPTTNITTPNQPIVLQQRPPECPASIEQEVGMTKQFENRGSLKKKRFRKTSSPNNRSQPSTLVDIHIQRGSTENIASTSKQSFKQEEITQTREPARKQTFQQQKSIGSVVSATVQTLKQEETAETRELTRRQTLQLQESRGNLEPNTVQTFKGQETTQMPEPIRRQTFQQQQSTGTLVPTTRQTFQVSTETQASTSKQTFQKHELTDKMTSINKIIIKQKTLDNLKSSEQDNQSGQLNVQESQNLEKEPFSLEQFALPDLFEMYLISSLESKKQEKYFRITLLLSEYANRNFLNFSGSFRWQDTTWILEQPQVLQYFRRLPVMNEGSFHTTFRHPDSVQFQIHGQRSAILIRELEPVHILELLHGMPRTDTSEFPESSVSTQQRTSDAGCPVEETRKSLDWKERLSLRRIIRILCGDQELSSQRNEAGDQVETLPIVSGHDVRCPPMRCVVCSAIIIKTHTFCIRNHVICPSCMLRLCPYQRDIPHAIKCRHCNVVCAMNNTLEVSCDDMVVDCRAGEGIPHVQKCGWLGSRRELLYHVLEIHDAVYKFACTLGRRNMQRGGSHWFSEVNLVIERDEMFWQSLRITQDKFQETVQYIACENSSSEFMVTYNVQSLDGRDERRTRFKAQSLYEDVNRLFDKGLCFELDFPTYESEYIDENNFMPGYGLAIQIIS
ncbi:uncharacterized protein [Periplaneta americana]|uniref:uncharacterized protein n=1 Tax=Periplaneta americana TaxID=6978 RepID=UPI0037E88EF5